MKYNYINTNISFHTHSSSFTSAVTSIKVSREKDFCGSILYCPAYTMKLIEMAFLSKFFCNYKMITWRECFY